MRPRFNPWVRNIPWRREWKSTPVFLPGKCHGQRRLAGYSPWGRKKSDMIERLTLTCDLLVFCGGALRFLSFSLLLFQTFVHRSFELDSTFIMHTTSTYLSSIMRARPLTLHLPSSPLVLSSLAREIIVGFFCTIPASLRACHV